MNRPELDAAKLARTRKLMSDAVSDVLVEGYEPLVSSLVLPDPDDRHVLAAAIRSGAQAIVTHNLDHFPAESLCAYGIEAIETDNFVLDLLDLAPGAVLRVLQEQAAALRNPPLSLDEVMASLEANGPRRSMAEVRQMLGSGS